MISAFRKANRARVSGAASEASDAATAPAASTAAAPITTAVPTRPTTAPALRLRGAPSSKSRGSASVDVRGVLPRDFRLAYIRRTAESTFRYQQNHRGSAVTSPDADSSGPASPRPVHLMDHPRLGPIASPHPRTPAADDREHEHLYGAPRAECNRRLRGNAAALLTRHAGAAPTLNDVLTEGRLGRALFLAGPVGLGQRL